MRLGTMGTALAVLGVLCVPVAVGALAIHECLRADRSTDLQRIDDKPTTLLKRWAGATRRCADNGWQPTAQACLQRKAYASELEAQGWCYGESMDTAPTWAPCKIDPQSTAARPGKKAERETAEREETWRRRREAGAIFGNGLMAPTLMTLADFKATNPDAECTVLEQSTMCELASPSVSECPSENPCTGVAYEFNERGLRAFIASYDRIEWANILRATEERYPEGAHRWFNIYSMSVESWSWKFDVGSLTFNRYGGATIDGGLITQRFTIIFSGPENS